MYIPKCDISIDESLMAFKGRLSWKQFISTKRARFGLNRLVQLHSKNNPLHRENHRKKQLTRLLSNNIDCARTLSKLVKQRILHRDGQLL